MPNESVLKQTKSFKCNIPVQLNRDADANADKEKKTVAIMYSVLVMKVVINLQFPVVLMLKQYLTYPDF